MHRKITFTTSYGKQRMRIQTINDDKDMTDQSFKDDCDVNNILKRFMKTGQSLPAVTGRYNDVSEIPDLAIALTQLNEAQQKFDSLPSHIRKRFGNSPVELVEFLRDSKNYDQALELGLVKPRTDTSVSAGTKASAAVGPKSPKKTAPTSANNDDDLNDDDKSRKGS